MVSRKDASRNFLIATLTGLALLLFPGLAVAGPSASLDKTSIDFGTHNSLSDIGLMNEVTVKSTGDMALVVKDIWLDQATGGPVSADPSPSCNDSILPSVECRVSIGFNYWSARGGAWSGTLNVKTNASPEPLTVSLSGVVEHTTVEIDQTKFNFGRAPIGLPSNGPSHTFKVTSTGSIPFSPGAYIYGKESGSFRIVKNQCAVPIQPGASCLVTVEFRPVGDKPGPREAWMSVGGGMIPKGAELKGTATERLPARVKIKVDSPRRAAAGGPVKFGTTVTSVGGFDAAPVKIRAVGPKRFTVSPGVWIYTPALGPGATSSQSVRLRLRRKAAGRKVSVKVVARQGGKQIWSAKRTIRITPAS